MKLSLSLLSILQNPSVVSADEGGEDAYEISACFTTYVRNSHLKNVTSLDSLCTDITNQFTNQNFKDTDVTFSNTGCYNTCNGDGNGKGGFLDNNSLANDLAGELDNVFDGSDPITQKETGSSCFDYCFELDGLQGELITGIPTITSAGYTQYADDVESLFESAGASLFADGSVIHTTTFNAKVEFTNHASGDGDVTTTESTGTGGTTAAPVTTTAAPDILEFQACITIYFPILWILQTLFPGLDSLCPVYGDLFCNQFESVKGLSSCWADCSNQCTGDGVPDAQNQADSNSGAASASGNTDQVLDENGKVITSADPKKFGCFDFCVTIQLDDLAYSEISNNTDSSQRTFSFGQDDMTALVSEQANNAFVEAIIAGPSDLDTSNLDANTGGYTCVEPTADPASCLLDDTLNAGFNAAASGDASDALAPTIWDKQTSTQLTGIDCSVSNGGCSHTCSGEGLNGVCSCPNQCWQLDSDQTTCNIHPDMVRLTCHPDKMEAHLAKCVVAGTDAYQLGNSVCSSNTTVTGTAPSKNPSNAAILKRDSCDDPTMGVNADVNGDGIVDNGCITFVIGLDECSMQVNADHTRNKLTFMQELVSTDFSSTTQINPLGNSGSNAMVNFDPRVSVDFTCEYTADYTTNIANVEAKPDEVESSLDGKGVFGYSLKTVQPTEADFNSLTNDWVDIHSTADGRDYMVGSTLYFQICDQQELSNVYFSVPECTVYNDDMSESYQIITDHCVDPFVNTERVGRFYDNRFKTWNTFTDQAGFIPMPSGSTLAPTDLATNQCLTFSYTVFEFVSNADDSADLKLSCKVKACEYSEAHPDNMATCIDNTCNGSGRKRRSLDSENYVTVTQNFRVARPNL